ncbi:MAG: VWA domain-containing protein [Acidobacteriota bacterium]
MVKVTTDLVTVPIIAANAEGTYVPDLKQEEFNISEDGVKQDVAFFATVSAPFHVVLLLDTSASTQEKIGFIRKAAIAFVEQLQPGDRVKVISFDDQVRDLNEFTSNRAALRSAINKTESGKGTKVYDALELALGSLRSIQGRKAIVLFSDGMDWHSDRASFDSTLHWLDEEELVVYPIRFETRAETERLARQQAEEQGSGLPTLDVIRKTPPGTTAPTFPSDDPDSIPTSGYPGRLPLPAEILRRRNETERRRGGTGNPRPDSLPPDPERNPRDIPNDDRFPRRGSRPKTDDSISVMLDQAYLTADSYLIELANRSGGRLVRADTLATLPDAFAQIAAELRTQYAIGYYPTNKARDGKYRKIRVTSTRKNLQVRARPGYRAPSGG